MILCVLSDLVVVTNISLILDLITVNWIETLIMKTMNRFILFFFGCTLLFSMQGCSPYYAFGNSGVDPIVFIKPLYADSTKQTTYIGGKYDMSNQNTYLHYGEMNYFGQMYWAQSHIAKNYNYSYGAFGYAGSYKVLEVENFNGNKSYYGGGLSGEFNFNLPTKTIDIHLIGLKGTLLYENGDFTRFRQMAAQQNLISGVSSSLFAYNISMTEGIEFKIMKDRFGIDFSNGLTFFVNDSPEFFTSSVDIHYTYKQITLFIQNTDSFFGIGNEFTLGINYRLNYK